MNILRRTTAYFIFALVFNPMSFINAQTITNTTALAAIANNRHLEFLRNRLEVEGYAKKNNVPTRQTFPNGTVIEMHHLDKGRPVYYITTNLGAAKTTRTDQLWPSGSLDLNLTGSGYSKLGVWDGGGVFLTHQEFGTRVTQVDGYSTISNHSTHVAGTLIANGSVSNAKGMAYQADLDAYHWLDDESEMATAAAAGMEVSNHSYGFATGWSWIWNTETAQDDAYWNGDLSVSTTEDYTFGFYGFYTTWWDYIAYIAPNYLIVKSVGNDRNDSYSGTHYHSIGGEPKTDSHDDDDGGDGYDCIPSKGVAKNILTIGAVDELVNYTQPLDVIMSTFSSWGPTDDGRIKPDLVAKGVNVYSAIGTGTSSYASSDGTSMASPNVAGTLALLQQHYQNTHSGSIMRSATLKGLAIHTADEAGTTSGPDYQFGWGLLNAERAAKLISFNSLGYNFIDEQELANGATFTRDVQSNGTKPLRVTICWTDPVGTPVTSDLLNNRTPMLKNDLDLKLIKGGTTYYPWKLDPENPSYAATNSEENIVDNVEQVYIPSPEAGTYTIEVDHSGTLTTASQAFSIIVSGNGECTDGAIIYNTETAEFNFCEEGLWVEK